MGNGALETNKPKGKVSGKVYLVGAGPGDVAYLTLAAQTHLQQAEVLIYDALVDNRLLALVPSDCECIQVGKRGGQPSLKQPDIDRLLVQQCQRGQRVVRLKSGDPFIFGRCWSEIQALTAAGCAYEVIPGLSSALAAPLLAGIPLTDPLLSRSFTVLTAHDLAALNWSALVALDTLVILMGGRNLPDLLDCLQTCGRSPQTPIAIIRWAGHPDQQIWTGTLATILNQVQPATISPAVIVIGEVVRLRDQIAAASMEANNFPENWPPSIKMPGD